MDLSSSTLLPVAPMASQLAPALLWPPNTALGGVLLPGSRSGTWNAPLLMSHSHLLDPMRLGLSLLPTQMHHLVCTLLPCLFPRMSAPEDKRVNLCFTS